jgi:hypothetical protein
MFTQFVNYIQKNVGTTAVTLVTCPASNQLVVNQLSCANITSLTVTCSVTVTRGGTVVFIVNNATVPANGSLICAGDDQKIVLMAGDVLQVRSSLANSIDAVVSGVLNDFNSTATVPTVVSGSNATITVAPNAATIGESGTVTFTITTNLPNGTVVYWENIGTTDAQDFTDDLNSGAVAVSGGSATFTRTLRSTLSGVDRVGEGNETIVIIVGTTPRFLGGGALAAAGTVAVIDTPVTTGLIMHLDAGNPASYPGSGATWTDLTANGNTVLLQGSPPLVNRAIQFDGSTQWARTSGNLNLTTFDSVTVEIVVRSTPGTVQCAWEHTTDWNTNVGGIGLFPHVNGSVALINVHHTNHNTGPARNYEASVDANWAVHTNIYSRIGDTTGRLTYVNGQLVSFSPVNGYATGTATTGGSFANALLYFAARGGSSSFMPGRIMAFRVYNRKLSAEEIQQNYLAMSGRFTPPTSSSHAFTVAQSTNQGLFTTDGTNWTETTLPSSGIWLDSNHNPASPGRACALRWGGAIYSTDFGQTWIAATGMGGAAGTVSALAPVTSTVWITVGTGTTEYFRSTNNGQTWTVFNFGSTYNGTAVAGVGAGLAVIVTNSLTYYTTTDGSSFTTRTFPSNPAGITTGFTRIEYVNGLYIVLGAQGGRYIMTSPDGVNWTVRDVGLGVTTGNMRDISFGNGLWVIVCDITNRYYTSTDLVNWTARLMPANRRWGGIAYINDQWVAIVDGDTAGGNIKATSTDGINWVESALASTNRRWADLTEVRLD